MKKKIFAVVLSAVLALSLGLVMAAPAGADPGPGIVGLWHLDDGSGSTASDSSVNSNDGTLSGGKFGNALDFDGNDYVSVLDDASLDVTAELTIEAWTKTDVTMDSNAKMQIVDKGEHQYHTAYMLMIWQGNLYGRVGSSSTTCQYPYPTDGNWHHVAYTFKSSEQKLYIDGSVVATNTGITSISTNTQPLLIGNGVERSYYWDGLIDEVRISDVARTSFDLINQPDDDTDTVGLWHFDESVDSTTYDTTANDNDGTINGASWAGPTWIDGMFDDALSFDGSGDYVDCGDISTANWTNLTNEAWVWWDGVTSHGYAGVYYKGSHSGIGRLLINSGGMVLVQNGNGNFFSDNTGDVPTNQWCHIAYVYDQTAGKEYIYVDANKVGEQSRSGDITQNSTGYRIGYGYYDPEYYAFSGLIDEVHIWDEALSASQIALSYSVSVNWLPPVTNADFVLKDGTTLPLKFQLFDNSALVCSMQSVSLEITGPASFNPIIFQLGEGVENLRWNADECCYIANLKTKVDDWPEGTYTSTVHGIVTGTITFELSADKGVSRGNSGK